MLHELAASLFPVLFSVAFFNRKVRSTNQGEVMKIARKYLISGEVQGVGYRFFAQRAAARHQVQGYVRNLADGRVEAFAEGNAEAVEAFKHDLATGPAYARVENVEEINLDPTESYSSFRIER
jgi:acylphosphatase